jgi:hypothetical protein
MHQYSVLSTQYPRLTDLVGLDMVPFTYPEYVECGSSWPQQDSEVCLCTRHSYAQLAHHMCYKQQKLYVLRMPWRDMPHGVERGHTTTQMVAQGMWIMGAKYASFHEAKI